MFKLFELGYTRYFFCLFDFTTTTQVFHLSKPSLKQVYLHRGLDHSPIIDRDLVVDVLDELFAEDYLLGQGERWEFEVEVLVAAIFKPVVCHVVFKY